MANTGDSEGGGGGSSFDGIIKAWPEESTLSISNVPKEKNDFILMMACEMYKNQHIEHPRKQADLAIEYAIDLYNALKSKGYL